MDNNLAPSSSLLANAYDLFDRAIHHPDENLTLPEETFKYICNISDLNIVKGDVLIVGSGKDGIPIMKYCESQFTDTLKLVTINLSDEEIYISSTNQIYPLELLPKEDTISYISRRHYFRDLFVLKSLIKYVEAKLIIFICNLGGSSMTYYVNHLNYFSHPYNKIPTIGYFLMPFRFEHERKHSSSRLEKDIISKDFTGCYFIDMEYWLDQEIKKKHFINIRKETSKYVSSTINLISEMVTQTLTAKRTLIPKVNSLRIYYADDTESVTNYFNIIQDIMVQNNNILKIGLLGTKAMPTVILSKKLKKMIPKLSLHVKFHEEKGNVLIVFLE